MHEDMVDGQAMQPGGEGGFPAETADFAKELDENFLRQILCFRGIGDHPQAQAVNPTMMTFIKRLERRHVAACGGLRQVVIGRGVVDSIGCHVCLPVSGASLKDPHEISSASLLILTEELSAQLFAACDAALFSVVALPQIFPK